MLVRTAGLAMVVLLASTSWAQAQTVPHNDAREFSETVQVENQWTPERDDLPECNVEPTAEPFFHLTSPNGQRWDGGSDPGDQHISANDPCGLRFENLSGVYVLGTSQYVVSHDPRSGRIEMRYLYLAPNEEPRLTWDIGLGRTLAEGRLHADDMWLNVESAFPPWAEAQCPDQYLTSRRAAILSLQRNEVLHDQGPTEVRTVITFSTPRLYLSGSCEVTFMEPNRFGYFRLELVP